MPNKKIYRQLSRYLGVGEDWRQDINYLGDYLGKCEDLDSKYKSILQNFPDFIDVVESSYVNYEDKINIAERNLSVSSEELLSANRSINSIMNSLGQGFVIFDRNAICGNIYSAAFVALLEEIPSGRDITSILKLNAEQADNFKQLLAMIFTGNYALSFDEIIYLAPRKIINSKGSHIKIDYRPDSNKDGKIDKIILIATDISEQVAAKNQAEEKQKIFESLERILRDRRAFGVYIHQARDFIDFVEKEHPEDWTGVQREVHTLKSGAGMFKLNSLASELHELESVLKLLLGESLSAAEINKKLMDNYSAVKTELRIIIKKFNDLFAIDVLELEKESSIGRNNIYQFADYLAEQNLDSLRDEYIKRVFAESMQANIALYDKLINDIAMRFNKEVNPIKFLGHDVFIIPENYRGMLGAFAHIFRNIVDHAIEYPDDRKDKNKPSAGNISIETGGYKDDRGNEHISIKIKDDGNGIDANFVRERLKSNNPSVDWTKMSDFEILQQIFSSGFSTKTQVTEDSGRGVGMDVVRNEILKLGGDIIVNSQVGVGTEFSIHVPYMLKLNALK